ncbi:sulfite exporter TauE/SafE family protein [Immundisolibacter sp.]|uniref:sulfite exporter TauE/SafE family protein n=1 Tax=Immundisolibacter sp. TaxID=1934948 RepID=UPI0026085077|nr:sulfite exporter TauE/SafE family protein [Immundisolibacter sp.]MDD3652537.1 sulfite exporter TauE/SafE family protein [Immundisolibacter sp.]
MEGLNALAGFGVGLLVGLTGVGGGSLMTPILVLLFGHAPAVAVGTDLWFAALTKSAGSVLHHGRGTVDWQVLRRLWLGSLPAALLTLLWMHLSGFGRQGNGALVAIVGGVLLLTALAMLFKNRIHAVGQGLRTQTPDAFKRVQPALTVVAGAVLGVLVTLTSIGAGALGTVMLVYLYPRRLTSARLVGTDILHAVPLTILAGTGHLLLGNVDLPLLGSLLLGSIPGVLLGSHYSSRAPDGLLRPVIAGVLVLVAIKMLLG